MSIQSRQNTDNEAVNSCTQMQLGVSELFGAYGNMGDPLTAAAPSPATLA